MTFLLCDIITFGRLNLKNLQQIQKELPDKIKGNNFTRVSGLPDNTGGGISQIHDQLVHRKVPMSIKKYLPNQEDIKYKTRTKYLPLANDRNQTNKNLKNRNYSPYVYNASIETVTGGMQGQVNDGSKEAIIGRALRKKKLSPTEKIATRFDNSVNQILLRGKPVDESDVQYLKAIAKQESNPNPRLPRKIKGTKRLAPTIEEKKQNLKQKYGIR